MNKNFWLLIIFLGIIGIFVYEFSIKIFINKLPLASITDSPKEDSNLKNLHIYQNSKNKFSLKYPSGWYLGKNNDSEFAEINSKQLKYFEGSNEVVVDEDPALGIYIRVFEKVEDKKSSLELAKVHNYNSKYRNANLGGIDATIIEDFNGGNLDGMYIVKNDIQIMIGARGVKNEQDEEIIKQIFSSFKFIK